MKNANFQELYRKTYSDLGFELKSSDGIEDGEIRAAEEKLQLKVPPPLRDYYAVAGKEKILNRSFNRLLLPENWDVHDGKLIFLEENQRVVKWGIDPQSKDSDPTIFQNPVFKGKLKTWYDEKASCSKFLVFHLYLQAAYGGGMPCLGAASALPHHLEILNANWGFIGENGGMRAYSKSNRAICIAESSDFFTEKKKLRICAGASDDKLLDDISKELKVTLEKWTSTQIF